MKYMVSLLLLSGCAGMTDRIADTKKTEVFTIEKRCTIYAPRDWLDSKDAKLEALIKQADGCFKEFKP